MIPSHRGLKRPQIALIIGKGLPFLQQNDFYFWLPINYTWQIDLQIDKNNVGIYKKKWRKIERKLQ